jgi:hypothetical protein
MNTVITKLKKKIPTAPVAHLFPAEDIDRTDKMKLKIVTPN